MGTGFGAWLVGMHNLFEYNTIQSGVGVGYEFIYIIAAVIGGCLLTGGYGSVVGASIGALIYGMVSLGISYAGWDVDWLKTFLGVMLIGAVLVNQWVKKKADA
jgi:simple sugar transport system permease protein